MYQADLMQDIENDLIERLPKAARKRFLALCEPFQLVLSAELSVRGQQLTHAYFPGSGFISLVIDIDSHPPLEVGMVGRESMLGSERRRAASRHNALIASQSRVIWVQTGLCQRSQPLLPSPYEASGGRFRGKARSIEFLLILSNSL